jgi:hypothetical protein
MGIGFGDAKRKMTAAFPLNEQEEKLIKSNR